jgi:hypothetical protein
MSARRLIAIAALVLVALALTVSVIGAQGPGNGNGAGQGGCPEWANCSTDPQNDPNGPNGRFGPDDPQGFGPRGGMNGVGGFGDFSDLPAAAEVPLPDSVIEVMKAGLMDEYNAYAAYAAIMEQFGTVRPFTNIQRAEAQHIAAWEYLFERYGLELPAAPESVTLPDFASQAEACQAAADLESANLNLYAEMAAVVADYPDILQVVTALGDASEFSHLPALERCAGM